MAPLEELLDRRRVSDKGGGLLDADGRDVADGGEDRVWDPLDEAALVLLTDVVRGFFDVAHGDLGAAEDGGDGEPFAEVRVGGWIE
jgi:hypothetical protein